VEEDGERGKQEKTHSAGREKLGTTRIGKLTKERQGI